MSRPFAEGDRVVIVGHPSEVYKDKLATVEWIDKCSQLWLMLDEQNLWAGMMHLHPWELRHLDDWQMVLATKVIS